MFKSLEEALEKAEPVTSVQTDGAQAIEEQGVKFYIKSAEVLSSEASFVGRDVRLSADNIEGAVSIVFAVPPQTPLYEHDKKFLADIHKQYSPKGTAVKSVDYFNVNGKLVVANEFVMPVMGMKLRQRQLLFDCADKQVSITACSPNKDFPTDRIVEEILHSLFISD